jgi:integrase
VLGARRGEVCRLRWSHIDLDRGEILVGGKITSLPGELRDEDWTKNRSKRRVALGPAVVELLRARRVEQAKQALASGVSLSSDAYVFSHEADGSRPIRPDGVTQRFTALARRLGVQCRLHDLRHFLVTQLIAAGVDVRTVSGRVGHRDGGRTTLTAGGQAPTHGGPVSARGVSRLAWSGAITAIVLVATSVALFVQGVWTPGGLRRS